MQCIRIARLIPLFLFLIINQYISGFANAGDESDLLPSVDSKNNFSPSFDLTRHGARMLQDQYYISIYLPLIAMGGIIEIDNPGCRWPYESGEYLFISYRWGDRLTSPGSLWRNAFEAGLTAWNVTPTRLVYYSDDQSVNIINTYDDDSGNRGITYITCQGDTTISVEILGNIYYDILDGYTVDERRGIAAYEVGHGASIGHILAGYVIPALMSDFTPLEFFDNVNTPQEPDINLVNHIYW